MAGVRDDQLTGPTPCTGTSVAAMLDHLLGLTTAFRMAAKKVRSEGTAQFGSPALTSPVS